MKETREKVVEAMFSKRNKDKDKYKYLDQLDQELDEFLDYDEDAEAQGEYENDSIKILELQRENDQLRRENHQLKNARIQLNQIKERNEELQQLLNKKQQETEKLSDQLLSFQSESGNELQLTESLRIMQERLNKTMKELQKYKQENPVAGLSKDDLADIFLDAKANANRILESAQEEADHILQEAYAELDGIQRESAQLYQRVIELKAQTDYSFDDIIAKVDTLNRFVKIDKNQQGN